MASLRLRTRKDGSAFTAVLFRVEGRQSSLSFDEHQDAVDFCGLVNQVGPAKALEIVNVDASRRSMTVAAWIGHHIDHLTGVEPATVRRYRSILSRDIGPAFGSVPLKALTREDVSRWVNAMTEAKVSGKTIANKHGFLSGALNAAVIAGHIDANPCAGRKLPRWDRAEMVFLTRDEFATLKSSVTEFWRPLVQFLVASGCRWSEATALKPGDVDRQGHTVRITRAWKYGSGSGYTMGVPKTRKSVRTVNVPSEVLDDLDYGNKWLFVNRDGGPVRIHGFTPRVWVPAVNRANLDKRPRIHDLRHTCASWMIAAGVPLPVIQAHLGHESIKTTVDVYGHLDRDGAKAAADAIAKMLT